MSNKGFSLDDEFNMGWDGVGCERPRWVTGPGPESSGSGARVWVVGRGISKGVDGVPAPKLIRCTALGFSPTALH